MSSTDAGRPGWITSRSTGRSTALCSSAVQKHSRKSISQRLMNAVGAAYDGHATSENARSLSERTLLYLSIQGVSPFASRTIAFTAIPPT